MPSKQGGKGKTSSTSRKASHLRGPARTAHNKALKIARHAKRYGLTSAQLGIATQDPKFPRKQKPLPPQSMVMNGQPPKQSGRPLHMIICAGVLLEITPAHGAADNAKRSIFPRLPYTHEILHDNGRRVLIDSRKGN